MKEKVVFKEKKKPLSASDKVFNVFNYLSVWPLTLDLPVSVLLSDH